MLRLRQRIALTLLLFASCGPETPTEDLPAPVKAPELVQADEEQLGVAFRQLGAGDLNGCRMTAQGVLASSPAPATEARAHFLLGLGFHKAKQYADARAHFESAQEGADYPSKNALPYYLGWCYFWLGELELSESSFQQHVSATDEGDSHFGLGVIALERGQNKLAQEQLTIALKKFEARSATGDMLARRDVAKAHARLSDIDFAAEDYAAAKEHLSLAVNLDSDRAAVWYKLYQVALELEDEALGARGLSEYMRCQNAKDAGSGMASEGGQ